MDKFKTDHVLIIIIGLVAGAISHWFHSYSDPKLFELPIQFIMTISSFIAAFISKLSFKKRTYINSLIISLGVFIAVIGRIIFDINSIPTSHNLLPLELGLDIFLIILASFAGTYFAQLVNCLRSKNKS